MAIREILIGDCAAACKACQSYICDLIAIGKAEAGEGALALSGSQEAQAYVCDLMALTGAESSEGVAV